MVQQRFLAALDSGVFNVQIKRDNPKAFQTIELKIKELSGLEGRVGWIDGAKYDNGLPIATAAALNELGHGPTPPRPFIRPTIAKQQQVWARVAADGAKAIIGGTISPENLMEQLTEKARGDIEQTILEILEPPLSPITIELRAMKKKNPNLRITGTIVGEAARRVKQPGYQKPNVNDKPLVDSGKMVAHLDRVVIKK